MPTYLNSQKNLLLSTLADEMAAHRQNTSFVFVDTEEGMRAFLDAYPSIANMLNRQIRLEEMTAEELLELFRRLTRDSFEFVPEVESRLPDFFRNLDESRKTMKNSHWANGDEIVRLVDDLRRKWECVDGAYTNTTPPRRIITEALFPEELCRFFVKADPKKEEETILPASIAVDRLHIQPQTRCNWESAVVMLEVIREGQHVGNGTGFLISEDGVILTNEHVAAAEGDIVAWLHLPGIPGGRAVSYPCTRMKPFSKAYDMAMLKIEGSGFPCVALTPSGEMPPVGTEIYSYGFPLGTMLNHGDPATLNPTWSMGHITGFQTVGEQEICFCDLKGTYGSSGGPVFDQKTNRVIGVFSGAIADTGAMIVEDQKLMHEIRYFWNCFVTSPSSEAEEIKS